MNAHTRRTTLGLALAVGTVAVTLAMPTTADAHPPSTTGDRRSHQHQARNRAAAIDAYTRLFAGDSAAVDRYVARDVIDHDPKAPRDAFAGYKHLAAAFTGVPFELWEPLRVVSAGDVVGIQGLYHVDSVTTFRPTLDSPGVVGFDLFRFDDGKIVEHWDARQDIVPPSQTPDDNDMIGGAIGVSGHPVLDPKVVVDTVVDISRGDATHIGTRFSPDYVNHNPFGTDGWAGVASLAAAFGSAGFPMYSPRRWFADGDLVILQGVFHLRSTSSFVPDRNGPGVVAFDIFRIGADGRIVEHWDILQDNVPASSTVSGRPMI